MICLKTKTYCSNVSERCSQQSQHGMCMCPEDEQCEHKILVSDPMTEAQIKFMHAVIDKQNKLLLKKDNAR